MRKWAYLWLWLLEALGWRTKVRPCRHYIQRLGHCQGRRLRHSPLCLRGWQAGKACTRNKGFSTIFGLLETWRSLVRGDSTVANPTKKQAFYADYSLMIACRLWSDKEPTFEVVLQWR